MRKASTLLCALGLWMSQSGHAQILSDGSFEDGPAGTDWQASSAVFGGLVCDVATCGISSGTGPKSGAFWAWFGGAPSGDQASLEQTITLPQAGIYTLRFEFEHPTSSGNGLDFFKVTIDGTELFRLTDGEPGYTVYGTVSADLTSYADGGNHTLRFYSEVSGVGGLTNFFVDDVSIDSPPAAGAAPPGIFSDDFESGDLTRWSSVQPPLCSPNTDSDNDRLFDCVETNTGVFVDSEDTGTDPNNPDTDGDGLLDGDEVLGIDAIEDGNGVEIEPGVPLPDMGVGPLHKDILIEYDWFQDSIGCAAHSHRPTATALDRMSDAFANPIVSNPDGTTGINVIHDYGQGGLFTGGNLIADTDGDITGGLSLEFYTYKEENFAIQRRGIFRYVILPHSVNSGQFSGVAEVPGDDIIVSLECASNTAFVSQTVMHELGHNLLLRHGGFDSCNYKPNYNSIMNYNYQFPGTDTNCTPPGDGGIDYSHGSLDGLVEDNLNEQLGICGLSGPPWDWNNNSVLEISVSVNINAQPNEGAVCGGDRTTLDDHNDWANLMIGVGLSESLARSTTEIIDCDNPVPGGVEPERFLARQAGAP